MVNVHCEAFCFVGEILIKIMIFIIKTFHHIVKTKFIDHQY